MINLYRAVAPSSATSCTFPLSLRLHELASAPQPASVFLSRRIKGEHSKIKADRFRIDQLAPPDNYIQGPRLMSYQG